LSAFAALLVLLLAIRVVVYGVPFPGFGTIICVALIGFGVISLLLGVVGEYLALIYEEVKQRPNFVITEKVGM
jgi:dolichol-phosphate mannosyltransferase